MNQRSERSVSVLEGYAQWAESYDAADNPARTMALRALGDGRHDPVGFSVVELGCGTGDNIKTLCSLGMTQYLGVDASGEMLAEARKLAANMPSHLRNVEVELAEHDVTQPLPLSREFDVVLGDSAAGVGPDVLHFAAMADRVLVVTTPEVAALTDAYGVIKALDQFGIRTGADIPTPELVVNQCSGVEEGQDIARKLRQVCERFLARTPRQAGWIPRSRSVSQAAQVAAPFVGVSKRGLEQLCLRQIAGRFRTLIAIKAPLACP